MIFRAVFVTMVTFLLASCGRSGTPAQNKQQAVAKPPEPPPPAPAADDSSASAASASQFSFRPCTLPKGAEIEVKLLSVADTNVTTVGFLPGMVTSDVKASDGKIAIPASSPAVIMVRESGKAGAISHMVLGLYSVRIGDREHPMSDGSKEAAYLTFTEDAGKGVAHSAVHLQFGANLDFRLAAPVELR